MLNGTDIVLLAVTGVIAITALVRMMIARRDRLVAEVKQQVEEERRRKKKAKPQSPEAA